MNNKKGSHVGMMISFTMFITFIVFIYAIIQPVTKADQGKEAIVNYIERKLVENISSNLTIISVRIGANPASNCVNFSDLFMLSEASPSFDRVIVKNSTQQIQTAYYSDSPNQAADLNVDRASNTDTVFKIYLSNEFDEVAIPTGACEDLDHITEYNITSVSKSNNYIFENKINDLNATYHAAYNQLKQDLGIPETQDFGFVFKRSDNTNITAMPNYIERTSIAVKDIPVQYVSDETAYVGLGFISIRVW